MSYITLTPDDPDFQPYLLGSFARDKRALPVESFSQHSSRERITFRIVAVAEIQKPAWWKIYFRGCRPELLGLTLGPLFLTVMALSRFLFVKDWISLTGAAFGLFFLHVATFLFNDFRDHMRGVDFANRRRGSQVIQKGWASGEQVRGWAFMNAGLALACGLPALYFHWPEILFPVIGAMICVLALTWIPSKLVRIGAADVLVFVGLGPLLTGATAIVAFGVRPVQVIWLGCALGAIAVSTLQTRQLENLFRAGTESFRTVIGAFEFDRAKFMVLVIGIAVAVLQFAVAVFVLRTPYAAVGFVIALWPTVLLLRRIRNAASPLSSDLVHLGRKAVWSQAALLAWWGAAIWLS